MSGYVRLERMNENATHHYADYVKPKQFLPYNGLFTGEDYRHTAEAMTDIEVIYIPTDRFERFVSTQSSMLLYIIGQMNRILDLH
ncbi:cyclic nucleotide-binding domain-containing protein, partial [Bacillus sp. SIMBA_161]